VDEYDVVLFAKAVGDDVQPECTSMPSCDNTTASVEDLRSHYKHDCQNDASSADAGAWSLSEVTHNKRGYNDPIHDIDREALLLCSERLQKRVRGIWGCVE